MSVGKHEHPSDVDQYLSVVGRHRYAFGNNPAAVVLQLKVMFGCSSRDACSMMLGALQWWGAQGRHVRFDDSFDVVASEAGRVRDAMISVGVWK